MPEAKPLPQGHTRSGGERLPLPAEATMTAAQRDAARVAHG